MIGDFLDFCLSHGFGGLILLLLTLGAALLVVMGLLAGIAQAARAFAQGWRDAG